MTKQERLAGSSVLITGGTRGLGKALGLAFAHAGARVFLTYKWGSVDPDQVRLDFEDAGLPAPEVIQSDVGDPENVKVLMAHIQKKVDVLDAIVSNVAFAKVINSLDDFKLNSLELSLRYSAWPLVDLIRAAQLTFGTYPHYLIGISSDGGEICYPGYAFAGIAKAALETLCRYLALTLKPYRVCVNAVRPGFIDTDSLNATFSPATVSLMQKMDGMLLNPDGVAQACVGLCSGWMDAVTGQVITVDEGWSLVSPISYLDLISQVPNQEEKSQ